MVSNFMREIAVLTKDVQTSLLNQTTSYFLRSGGSCCVNMFLFSLGDTLL